MSKICEDTSEIKVDCNVLIFLDVDGVLNQLNRPEEELMLDEDILIDTSHPAHPQLSYKCLNCLHDLLISMGERVKIVLSSSWRLDEKLIVFLTASISRHFKTDFSQYLIGTTNKLAAGSRSNDIVMWMENYYCTDGYKWIAIDDNVKNLALIDEAHKVLTYDTEGLSNQKVLEIMRKLAAQQRILCDSA